MWSKFTKNNFDKLKNIMCNKLKDNNILVKKLKEIRYGITNIPNLNYKISKTKINLEQIINMASSKWVDKMLTKNLDTLLYDYQIEWDNNIIYLKCTEEKFNNFINRLPIFLKILDYIKNKSPINITMYLILSPLKKNIDSHKHIKPKNINSGYTDLLDNYIFIWREEEFEKVCFHEIMHLYNLDHRDENLDSINNHESLYEAITDFKAICFNIIYISILTKKKIASLLSLEQCFINNQANIINKLIDNNIKCHSPAFAYFILKALIFNYFSLENQEYQDIFNKEFIFKNFINKIYENNKIKELFKNSYVDFYSIRMSFFELI